MSFTMVSPVPTPVSMYHNKNHNLQLILGLNCVYILTGAGKADTPYAEGGITAHITNHETQKTYDISSILTSLARGSMRYDIQSSVYTEDCPPPLSQPHSLRSTRRYSALTI